MRQKITQLLGTKKNHATSQDKKKSCNLLGEKTNRATSWDKKESRNLSGQKKIMQPLGGKKYPTKVKSPNLGQKISQNKSKQVKMDPNTHK